MNLKKVLLIGIIVTCVLLFKDIDVYGVEFVPESEEAIDPGPLSSSVTDKTGTYSYIVVTNGVYIDMYLGDDEELDIPEKIDGHKVVGLYSEFLGGSNVKVVNIPQTVTGIYTDAFFGGWNLEEINVDSDNSIYASYDGMLYDKNYEFFIFCPQGRTGSVTLKSGIVYVCDYSFWEAFNVESITIPASAEDIGYMTFYDTRSLSTIIVNSSNPNFVYSSGILYDKDKEEIIKCVDKRSISVTIPSTVKKIREYAFYGCTNLPGPITLPSKLEEIGERAFQNCESLTGTITLPSTLSSIGKCAFYGCKSINKLVLPTSITEIPEGCFAYCESLKEIEIPSNISTIGNRAFLSCKKVSTLTLNDGIVTIGDNAFDYLSSLTGDLIIPDSVTTIGSFAFGNSPNIDGYIVLGSGIEEIAYNVFYSSSNAKGIIFRGELPTVSKYSFSEPYIPYYCLDNLSGFKEALVDKDVYLYSNNPIVVFVINGEQYMKVIQPCYGLTITEFSVSDIAGYSFEGWYYDQDYTSEYSFSDDIMYDTTIYAKLEEEIKYILGDVNKDGLVNADDAAIVLDLYKYNNATEEDYKLADVNSDNMINADDAALILDMYKYGY